MELVASVREGAVGIEKQRSRGREGEKRKSVSGDSQQQQWSSDRVQARVRVYIGRACMTTTTSFRRSERRPMPLGRGVERKGGKGKEGR